MPLSISKAWEESLAFVKREGQLLFPVAFFFLALPVVILQQMVPPEVANARPQTPADFAALFALLRPLYPAILLVILISAAGSLTLFGLMLKSGISVAEALNLGVRRLPVLIGAGLLITAAMMLAVLAVSIVLTLLALVIGPQIVSLMVITILVAATFFVSVRLLLMTCVVVAEPVAVRESVRRSWRITGGHFWRLLGFLLMVLLVGQIIQIAVQTVFGSIGGLLGGPSIAVLTGSLAVATVSTIWQVYFLTMVSRIYLQLRDAG